MDERNGHQEEEDYDAADLQEDTAESAARSHEVNNQIAFLLLLTLLQVIACFCYCYCFAIVEILTFLS
jgi:hypothetical protein